MNNGSQHAAEPFHQYMERKINESPIKQKEMAEELGFLTPNIISMFKQGKTRIPLYKIAGFAKLLNLDPIMLFRKATSEYEPELMKTLDELFSSEMLTKNELNIIHEIRRLSNNTDPGITGINHKAAIEEFVRVITSTSSNAH